MQYITMTIVFKSHLIHLLIFTMFCNSVHLLCQLLYNSYGNDAFKSDLCTVNPERIASVIFNDFINPATLTSLYDNDFSRVLHAHAHNVAH